MCSQSYTAWSVEYPWLYTAVWNALNRCQRFQGDHEQYTQALTVKLLMSCFEEHVKYDWRRIFILLTLQLKVRESLLYITKSG